MQRGRGCFVAKRKEGRARNEKKLCTLMARQGREYWTRDERKGRKKERKKEMRDGRKDGTGRAGERTKK